MKVSDQHNQRGFTLIEMSIVLVIIGLIVGGVLAGQDLIRAAYVRAQISQIEKFNTAVNTFYVKFQALPGDMNSTVAQAYGFAARGSNPGEGDGNGLIEGPWTPVGMGNGPQLRGEMVMFWVDLTTANGLHLNLIDGSFSTSTSTSDNYALIAASPTSADLFLPQAKIGGGNYISVWSGGSVQANDYTQPSDGVNYFDITAGNFDGLGCICGGQVNTIPVGVAFSIDSKVDDGFPQSGRVLAVGGGQGYSFVGDVDPTVYGPVVPGDGVATPASPTTCYDNGNVAGANEHYSLSQNRGVGNCSLSFRFH